MSDDKIFWTEFLELYRDLPALWLIKSSDYSNRDMKKECYQKLVDKLKEKYPDANKELVGKRINAFRTSYRKELKKVQASEKSGTGDVYKPSLWFYHTLSFLEDLENLKDTQEEEEEPIEKKRKVGCSADELIRLATQRLKVQHHSCQQIANVWGQKLSKMERTQRIIAEKVINDVMFNAELGLLNLNTKLINTNSACGGLNTSVSFVRNKPPVITNNCSSLQTPTTITIQRVVSPLDQELITDHEIREAEESYIDDDYDPLDNVIKVEP